MGKSIAQLRHRELTQEIYNIGDEVAEYIEHIMEAVSDWDAELVEDCLAEFSDIIAEARDDARVTIAELAGLRHALTFGIKQGALSVRTETGISLEQPEPLSAAELESMFPIETGLVVVRDLAYSLNSRTETVIAHLEQVVEWVLGQTENVANDLDCISLPMLYGRVAADVEKTTSAWLIAVASAHPAYVRTMRGSNPPRFLMERVRIDAVVARVAAKLARKRNAVS